MSAIQYAGATRFRLRFLLQEFALSPGDIFIGRGNDCQITIFDPLVSRRHARIRVQDEEAALEDLGSRNGCRVNGSVIRGAYTLGDGDRIRIGKHELVFGELNPLSGTSQERTTGSMVYCGSCGTAYPREAGMCPSCGAQSAVDEETGSGVFGEEGKKSWAVDMLLELFHKAMSSNRAEEAERVMLQTMTALEGQLKSGSTMDPRRLEPVVAAAIRLSEQTRDLSFMRLVADFHARAGLPIPPALAGARAGDSAANSNK